MTQCPECDAVLQRKDMIEGEVFSCPECGTELEVTTAEPFTVALAPQEKEDWGE
ncbi:MAG TPA: lysine biosynthesis protein LysW [Thermoplasmata archaeon]|nr:lysine biosynthesis protein LysW [Thermoplasmata archaeon]